ncbi:UbiA family prenyltransferase [Streptomyces sp. SAJ15]|uniref:UbiA family prenyltransferase n=1 Tax=Streptomyces sp. SAJ15 TaxID=2011095 RepID=UPI001643454C|nr:UbiA family prenyltransferase [Streptomyces sp. SAJ15]
MRDSLTIRRPEFMVAAFPIVMIPTLLMAADFGAVVSWRFAGAFVLAYLLFQFGDIINCLADRDLDAKYKVRLSGAVHRLGVSNVRWQMRLTWLAAVVLGTLLAVWTRHWDLIPLVVLELLWAAQYSVRPLHLKARGLWQVPTLCVIIFTLPMLIVTRVYAAAPPWELLTLIAGYSVLQEGVILVNTAEDIPEDAEAGLRTSALTLGPANAVAVGAAMVTIGGVACTLSLLALGDPSWGLLGLGLAAGWVLWELAAIWIAVRGKPLEAAVAALRPPARRMPAWLTAIAWGVLSSAALVLSHR